MLQSNIESAIVNESFSKAGHLGIINLLHTSDEIFTGNSFDVKGKKLANFITSNYLGFEQDERVKQAAIKGIEENGVVVALSRTYLAFEKQYELEQKLEEIYDQPVMVSSCTTLGNLAYVPLLVGPNDAIILDQFVHGSVKMGANLAKAEGVHVETIKHNQMEVLEKRIKSLRATYDKVWYFADSVYSMLGDIAPLQDIETLLNVYENFYCFIDDAHGMSWIGKHGRGYTLNKIHKHPKLYIIAALNKGYGAMGGALIFPSKEAKEYAEISNTIIILTTPIPPAGLYAGLEIANIHLSDEIYEKQAQLNERIEYFKNKAKGLNLPIVNFEHSPIFYLACGNLERMYILAKHLVTTGFLVAPAGLPVVPNSHSGLRITINLHHSIKDIENLLNVLAEYMQELEHKNLFNREEALKAFRIRNRPKELAGI